MLKIRGVVVLYNPDEGVFENIESYIQELDSLYLVDNSDNKNCKFIEQAEELEKCQYIDNQGNQGIAHALNRGAALAIKNGADWLLTMDQDSKFESGALHNMVTYIQNTDEPDIGIVSPKHLMTGMTYDNAKSVTEELTVMTSGNLLNLSAYNKVGEFREQYFIDCVDHEYCLRLQLSGLRVITLNNSPMFHSLGNTKVYNFLGKKIRCTNHSAIRRYYITRNRLDMICRYFLKFPVFCLRETRSLVWEFLKILFFEKNKLKKIKSCARGATDFVRGRFGKYT